MPKTKTVTTVVRRTARGRYKKRGKHAYRFNTMARSLCPNHLTVHQYVGQFNSASASVNNVGSATNVAQYITQSSSTFTYFAIPFRLDDIPQVATYAALFDRYKIKKVIVHFKPMFNVGDVKTDQSAIGFPQTFLTTIDYDDANVPTSLDVVRDYQMCREHNFYKPFSIELTPKIAISAYNGSFGAFANTSSYIDIASANVQHYGIKGALSVAQSTIGQAWTVSAEYIIDFKNIR